MDTPLRFGSPISSRPSRDAIPRRLIVTASVVAFAIRDWSLWVLLRDGPWGPPMRLVLGSEAVTDAVERILDALLQWPDRAPLFLLKAGWQEQQVQVWGSSEQGAAVSLIHDVLLRANRDELQPNLRTQSVPSLRVKWIPVADVESGQYPLAPEALPGVLSALHMLRSHVQHDPEAILRYLADMGKMSKVLPEEDRGQKDRYYAGSPASKDTLPLSLVEGARSGRWILTLAEAVLLYRAFLSTQ